MEKKKLFDEQTPFVFTWIHFCYFFSSSLLWCVFAAMPPTKVRFYFLLWVRTCPTSGKKRAVKMWGCLPLFPSLIKVSHFLVQPVTSQFPSTFELNGKVKWLLPSPTVEIIPLTSGSSVPERVGKILAHTSRRVDCYAAHDRWIDVAIETEPGCRHTANSIELIVDFDSLCLSIVPLYRHLALMASRGLVVATVHSAHKALDK